MDENIAESPAFAGLISGVFGVASKINGYNAVNLKNGYHTIEIRNPREIFDYEDID